MANIPVPERGQPLDLTYIYQIANAVNQLSLQAAFSKNKFVSVDTISAGRQDIKASDTRFIAGYAQVATNSDVKIGEELPFSYDFSSANFKYPPIVTATAVGSSLTITDASKNVSVVITNVTASKVEGAVRFGQGGTSTLGINIIAIGVPH
jgi:hypothetical protein